MADPILAPGTHSSPAAPGAITAAGTHSSPAAPAALVAAAPVASQPALAAATLTLGTGNSALTFTATSRGPAGNGLTVALATPADASAPAASASGTAITISAGGKSIMNVAFPGYDENLVAVSGGWTSTGEPVASVTVGTILTHVEGVWYLVIKSGEIETYSVSKTSAATYPDGLTGWTLVNASDQPTVTAATPSAAAIAAAVNTAALSITATAGGTGLGPVAAFSQTALAGGAGVIAPSPITP